MVMSVRVTTLVDLSPEVAFIVLSSSAYDFNKRTFGHRRACLVQVSSKAIRD